jgi:hypothetical protein
METVFLGRPDFGQQEVDDLLNARFPMFNARGPLDEQTVNDLLNRVQSPPDRRTRPEE